MRLSSSAPEVLLLLWSPVYRFARGRASQSREQVQLHSLQHVRQRERSTWPTPSVELAQRENNQTAMRNAKEHARLLPHSVCSPCPNTTSTSQSAASSNNTLPHLSHLSMKSWPNILFQASARKAASCPSASPPPLSLPSTVTSTSCSTSGFKPPHYPPKVVQTSLTVS